MKKVGDNITRFPLLRGKLNQPTTTDFTTPSSRREGIRQSVKRISTNDMDDDVDFVPQEKKFRIPLSNAKSRNVTAREPCVRS